MTLQAVKNENGPVDTRCLNFNAGLRCLGRRGSSINRRASHHVGTPPNAAAFAKAEYSIPFAALPLTHHHRRCQFHQSSWSLIFSFRLDDFRRIAVGLVVGTAGTRCHRTRSSRRRTRPTRFCSYSAARVTRARRPSCRRCGRRDARLSTSHLCVAPMRSAWRRRPRRWRTVLTSSTRRRSRLAAFWHRRFPRPRRWQHDNIAAAERVHCMGRESSRALQGRHRRSSCAAMREMLTNLQGTPVERVGLILGATPLILRVASHAALYRRTRDRFLEAQSRFDATLEPPEPPEPRAPAGRWSGLADKELLTRDDLRLVARLSKRQAARLRAAGVTTATELAALGDKPPDIAGVPPPVLRRLRRQAQLQIRARSNPTASPPFELVRGACAPSIGLGCCQLPIRQMDSSTWRASPFATLPAVAGGKQLPDLVALSQREDHRGEDAGKPSSTTTSGSGRRWQGVPLGYEHAAG